MKNLDLNANLLFVGLCENEKELNLFSNEELLEIVLSEKHKGHKYFNEIMSMAATQAKFQDGFEKYPSAVLSQSCSEIDPEVRRAYILAAIKTGNFNLQSSDNLMHMFFEAEAESIDSECTDLYIDILKKGLLKKTPRMTDVNLVKNIFWLVKQDCSHESEVNHMKEYNGKFHSILKSLNKSIVNSINWESETAEQMMDMIRVTNRDQGIVEKAISMNKFSSDALFYMFKFGILESDVSFINAIKTGVLEKELIVDILKFCNHNRYMCIEAVKTKVFTGSEMLKIWEISVEPKELAVEILNTSMLSEEELNSISGQWLVEKAAM